MSNLATVGAIYEAFGKGDVPTILSHLAPDVAWESWRSNSAQQAGVPAMKARSAAQDVGGFFEIVGSWTTNDFRVLSMMEGPNQVAVEVEADFTLPNGNRIEDQEIHLWTFNEAGKVSRFRHYLDTAKQIRASGLG
jgi:ketosteroid isomerase-like protein